MPKQTDHFIEHKDRRTGRWFWTLHSRNGQPLARAAHGVRRRRDVKRSLRRLAVAIAHNTDT